VDDICVALESLPLPDRVNHAVSGPHSPEHAQSSGESSHLPGEFVRNEVRALAAATLNVSAEQLLHALQTPTAGYRYSENSDDPRFRMLLQLVESNLGACPRERLFSSLPLRIASHAVLEAIEGLRRNVARTGFEAEIFVSYLVRQIVQDFVTIGAETALFEANTAVDYGLLTLESTTSIEDQLVGLYEDSGYIEYICRKYPLLPIRLADRAALLSATTSRLVERVAKDQSSLKERFDLGEHKNAVLKQIHGTSGDSHNGGSRVAVLEFDGGVKVVYKPRSTGGEAAFQRYLAWINARSGEWSFKTLSVWDRGEYGWMEYVESIEARCPEDVLHYYKRYGAMTAALSFICGTDVHFENLVAHGAHPVIIDLETILQPSELATKDGEPTRTLLNLGYYVNTPLFTGMIDPAFLDRTLNGSPLSLTMRSRSSYTRLAPTQQGKLVFEEELRDLCLDHLVSHEGSVVPYDEYIKAITAGYAACAMLLSVSRGALLDSVLEECFGACTIRVVFRYTQTYAAYLSALYSPYALQSIQNSEAILSKLWTGPVARPRQAALVPSEYRDLWRGDIPFFLADASADIIRNAAGELFAGVIAKSGMTTTRERFLDASFERNRSDASLVEFCLRTKAQGNFKAVTREIVEPDQVTPPALPLDPHALLRIVADRLIVDDDRVLFMDIVMGRDLRTSQAMLGQDFYTGLAGVCHALAYALWKGGSPDQQRKIERLANLVLLRSTEDARLELGACKGLGGFIYFASHLGVLSGKRHYFEIAEHIAAHASRLLFTDRHFDVFSGAAGALLASCSLVEATHSGLALSRVEESSDHLLKHARRSGGRTTWESSIPSSGPTTGFAHGTAGIAYSLLRAYRHLKQPALLDAALSAERFLADCAVEGQGRWKECEADLGPAHMDTWCHGLPGIARFYDELSSVTGEPRYVKIRQATLLNNAKLAEFENDSLCHGTMGNLDLLVSNMRHDSDAREVVSRLAMEVGSRPARCGNEGKHTSLSLFNGITGIAFQQLRVASQGTIPSVLCFEGPSRA